MRWIPFLWPQMSTIYQYSIFNSSSALPIQAFMAAPPFSQIINGASQIHSTKPSLPPPSTTFLASNFAKQSETSSQIGERPCPPPTAVPLHLQQKASRRSAILGGVSTSVAGITLLVTQTITPPVSLAVVEKEKETDSSNNGWWLTGPLPVPTVTNSECSCSKLVNFGFLVAKLMGIIYASYLQKSL